MPEGSLVVVGSTNTDMVLRVPRIPAPGETVLGGNLQVMQGGKGANQAVAAARAGGKVTFVTKIGQDSFGQISRDGFEEDGIDCQYIAIAPDAPSGTALIFVDDAGQNAIGVGPGANGTLMVEDLEPVREVIAAASVVLAQLEIPMSCIRWLAEVAGETDTRFILNPAPAPATPLDDEILKNVSILVPNESETELLTGLKITGPEEAEAAALQLLDKGIETVIVTLGDAGCMVVTAGERYFVPAQKVQAVDTTAAGDAFCGTLSVALAEGQTLRESVEFASAAAALSVTKMGAQPSMHTRSEIEGTAEC
jgi:ribokinase